MRHTTKISAIREREKLFLLRSLSGAPELSQLFLRCIVNKFAQQLFTFPRFSTAVNASLTWHLDAKLRMRPSSQPDELDAILNLETTFENEGRAEAAAEGAKAGELDGYDLGWKTGSSLSAELEFMHGAATALIALSKKHPTLIPPRALTFANKLITKSQTPLAARGNDETLDMEALTASQRSLFRRMMALAGLPGVKFESRESKLADLSF